ncbi:MAG: 3-deoxy-manno-octulosonate cytidylyltransferase [candidate division TM6 bacterium GW2011_GWF2_28_16]|nr:MAG: 3-deoxy-manno-octulosonate cytidylyltransferase [candidate division TM6 bacterium GW2011_GWF2_28_16]
MINKNINKKNIVCIIPARLKSTRFPEKILTNLAGKPLLQWAWDAANKTTLFKEIYFAIDSEKTAKLIDSFGGKYIFTSESCQSGTDRLVEIIHSGKVEADIWVNWQGDEPFITPNMLHSLLETCDHEQADMWTLKKRILLPEQISSPNIAKVVTDSNGYALYFSRSTIPYYRDKDENIEQVYYKHVGIYAYTANALRKIAQLGKCYLEDAEKLEQLRLLYYGFKIKLNETDQEVIGIDTPQDLARAQEYAKQLI